jgi:hypothetical protein
VGTQHLIVIVPGIGGSVLEDRAGHLVWGQRRPTMARALFQPERMDISQSLVPVDLLPTISVLPWKKVPGYDRLVQQLLTCLKLTPDDVDTARPAAPPDPGASILKFPYDFRLGMAVNGERLRDAIESRAGDRQVVVVAHSMGGLVARWWWGVLGGHRRCQALVTVGTPHRGAPKALDWLLNGVRLGRGPVASMSSALLGGATTVLREWDSTWELLPRYKAILDGAKQWYPHDLPMAEPWFTDRAKRSFDTHQELARMCDPATNETIEQTTRKVMAFYATGHATPARAIVSNGGVKVEKADAEWLPTQGWDGGDGTVPAISATPIEHDEIPDAQFHRRWLPEPHLPLASAAAVVRFVQAFEAAALSPVRGDAGPDRPWLGFDLDDVTAAGQPSELAVTLHGTTEDSNTETTDGIAARCRLFPEAGPPVELPCDAMTSANGTHHGKWRVAVPGLPPGAYRLRVELDQVPDVDRVVGEDVLGVVQP